MCRPRNCTKRSIGCQKSRWKNDIVKTPSTTLDTASRKGNGGYSSQMKKKIANYNDYNIELVVITMIKIVSVISLLRTKNK